MNSFGFYDSGFMIMSALFPIVFIIILGMFVVILVKNISQWNKNNHSPKLIVEATVVSKRTNTSHHHDGSNAAISHTSTTYYVTFEVESGDRMEFWVSGQEYGTLVEGDFGRLTFQGTRYLGFERTM
ncbi:MAG: DUF2500 domain-containing protein [Lachnospiraceae bacterium]